MDTINFYRVADEYGEFSNFAEYPIRVDGESWPTTEHYFQAQKFEDPAYRRRIRTAKSPWDAAQLGRDRKVKLRRDWESAKVGVMLKAVTAKFTQHDELRVLLLSTGDARLVEHTDNDAYWVAPAKPLKPAQCLAIGLLDDGSILWRIGRAPSNPESFRA